VLWVGNFRDVKRPEIFFQIASTFPELGWNFIMIGEHKEWLSIRNYAVPNNIVLLGQLSYQETSTWIKKSMILINTSVTEGFSNTMLEAWFSKTLFVSLAADPDDLLGKNCLGVYAQNDIHTLRTNLQDIINDYRRYEPIINKAFHHVTKFYNIDKNTTRLITALKGI